MTNLNRITLRVAGLLFILFNGYFLFENGNFIKELYSQIKFPEKFEEKYEYSKNDFNSSKHYTIAEFKGDCLKKGGLINSQGNCEFIKEQISVKFQLIGSIISLLCTLFIIILSIKVYVRFKDFSALNKQNLKDFRNIMICLFIIPATKLIFFKSFIPLYATYASLSLIIYLYFDNAQKEIKARNEEII